MMQPTIRSGNSLPRTSRIPAGWRIMAPRFGVSEAPAQSALAVNGSSASSPNRAPSAETRLARQDKLQPGAGTLGTSAHQVLRSPLRHLWRSSGSTAVDRLPPTVAKSAARAKLCPAREILVFASRSGAGRWRLDPATPDEIKLLLACAGRAPLDCLFAWWSGRSAGLVPWFAEFGGNSH